MYYATEVFIIKKHSSTSRLLILVIIVLSGFPFQAVTKNKDKVLPVKLMPGEQRVKFKSDDRARIGGSFFYPSECLNPDGTIKDNIDSTRKYPGVILIHMWQRDRFEWWGLIPHLQAENFAVLCFDLRGHGESVAKKREFYAGQYTQDMHYDAKAATSFLYDQGIVDRERISIVGASIGATVAVQMCAKAEKYKKFTRMRSMVLMSPAVSYFAVNVVDDMKKSRKTPALFMIEKNDPSPDKRKNHESGSKLYDLCESQKEKVVYEGVGHGTLMLLEEDCINKIVEWVKKYSFE